MTATRSFIICCFSALNKARCSRAYIESLLKIRPDYAVINDEKISPDSVKIGDIITVKSGERIPLDGIVTDGAASVDMSAITGESVPVEVNTGETVLSGGINLNGILKIKVTKEYLKECGKNIEFYPGVKQWF